MNDRKKNLIENRKKYLTTLDQSRNKLPFKNEKDPNFVQKNYQAVNDQVQALEAKLRSGKVGLTEEKKIVAEIATLNQARNLVKDYEKKYNTYLAQGPPIEKLTEEINALSEKINVITSGDKENQTQGEGFKKTLEGLDAQIEALRAKKRDLHEELKKLRQEKDDKYTANRETSQKRWDAYKADQEKKRQEKMAKAQADYEHRQKLRQQRDEERKRRQEEKEAQEEAKVPYEEEISLCDQLVMYLEGLNPDKAKGKKKPTKAQLVHPIEVFCSFEVLSLSPPAVVTNLEQSISDIKSRKENFVKLQAEKIKERQEQKKREAEAKEAVAKAEQEKLAEAAQSETQESATEKQPAEGQTKSENTEASTQTSSEDQKPAETTETKTETPVDQPPSVDSATSSA